MLDTLFAAPVVNGTAGLRVDIDTSNERMQKKIRDAQLQKIPYMLVVGEREAAEGKVAVRLRSGKDLGAMPLGTLHRPHQTTRPNPARMWRNSPFRTPEDPLSWRVIRPLCRTAPTPARQTKGSRLAP